MRNNTRGERPEVSHRAYMYVDIWRLGTRIADRALDKLGVRLRKTKGNSYWLPGNKTVYWNPEHGLTPLLHEVAHAALKHTGEKSWAAQVGTEAEAWAWAEEAAYHWGLPFNYRRANRSFSTYANSVRGSQGWKVAWRYK